MRFGRDNPALQLYDNLRFYSGGQNENIMVYGKATPDGENRILTVVKPGPEQPAGYLGRSALLGMGFLPARSLTRCWICLQIRLIPGRESITMCGSTRPAKPAHIFLVTRNILPVETTEAGIREIDYSKMLDAVRQRRSYFR